MQLIRILQHYVIGVNELGVSEPVVQRQGKNRIVVELPGVSRHSSSKEDYRENCKLRV